MQPWHREVAKTQHQGLHWNTASTNEFTGEGFMHQLKLHPKHIKKEGLFLFCSNVVFKEFRFRFSYLLNYLLCFDVKVFLCLEPLCLTLHKFLKR